MEGHVVGGGEVLAHKLVLNCPHSPCDGKSFPLSGGVLLLGVDQLVADVNNRVFPFIKLLGHGSPQGGL